MKAQLIIYILLVIITLSCSSNYKFIANKNWKLKHHDSLVNDTIELNKIKFTFKNHNEKTLTFNKDGSFIYDYKNYPFYNRSSYWVCGTDELELQPNSNFYKIYGDTIDLKFKGSVFDTPGCCNYDLKRKYKVSVINKTTIQFIKISDL